MTSYAKIWGGAMAPWAVPWLRLWKQDLKRCFDGQARSCCLYRIAWGRS